MGYPEHRCRNTHLRYDLIGEKHKEFLPDKIRDEDYYLFSCDEGTMALYITGGGGCLMKNFAKCNPGRVKFMDAIFAAEDVGTGADREIPCRKGRKNFSRYLHCSEK